MANFHGGPMEYCFDCHGDCTEMDPCFCCWSNLDPDERRALDGTG